jgi:hypothetical protein
MYEWLEKLKDGDVVIVTGGGGCQPDRIGVVDRLTKTQIVLKGGARYRRTSGREVGGSTWFSTHLVEPEADRVDKIREAQERRRMVEALHNVKYNEMSMPDLRAVFAALPRVKKAGAQ